MRVNRQAVRLLALPQLQAMLQVPQEFVSVRQLMKFLAADVAFVMQLLQGEQCPAGT